FQWMSLCIIVYNGIHKFFFFSSRRRHTRSKRDWSSDVCSSDLFNYGKNQKNMEEKLQNVLKSVEIIMPRELQGKQELEKIGITRSEERRVGKECRTRRTT